MYYQCPECEAIHETHQRAKECCEPIPVPVPDEQVRACEGCEGDDCPSCGGTGLLLKEREEDAS